MPNRPDWKFVAPLTNANHATLELAASHLGLKIGQLAVLVVLRTVRRGGLKSLSLRAQVPEEKKVVVRLPTKSDHYLIESFAEQVERASGRKVASRQVIAHILEHEASKKSFINSILGKSVESRGTRLALENAQNHAILSPWGHVLEKTGDDDEHSSAISENR